MKTSWRERLNLDPDLRNFTDWPVIPTDSVSSTHQAVFLRNKEIVSKVLGGEPLQDVAADYALSPGSISQIMDRCLGGDDAEAPALTQALIPHKVLVDKQRQQALPTLQQPRGTACSFKHLLRVLPDLKKELDAKIKAEVDNKPEAERLTPQSFLADIKRYLAEHHWPQDQYPYTCRDRGYAASRRYYLKRKDEFIQQKQARRKARRSHQFNANTKLRRALRAIQIDEHKLHFRSRINLVLNDELIPLPIARATVLTAIDVDCECMLGGHLVPTEFPNQQDLLALMDTCITHWNPMSLQTPGLSYAPGACFPSGLPEGFPISYGFVHMDNAWMHKARSIIKQVCEYFGATLNLGLPGVPQTRRLKESVYDYINTKFSNRVDSTTGSYPTDPRKESRKNQKKPSLLTYQTSEEALSVILTDWNVIPRPSIGGAKPLELMQYQLSNHFIRYIPESLRAEWKPFAGSIVVPLLWYRHENRHPHVNLFYTKYRGPGLISVATKDKYIRVEFDRRDVRQVHAYRLNGEDLGEIRAPMSWQRYPHSLATRQWIYRNAKKYRLDMRDPLTSYFKLLLENRGKPSFALSLLKVYTEFTADSSDGLVLFEDQEVMSEPKTFEQSSKFSWDYHDANHRS
ncbi:MAG: hypothetical protein N0C90_02415 [Candidatus Thiodiazotropha endolucinida]|nr:hypothetical protein [Candidatus Thiodiazotropha taylori]MCW4260203.1 hypothetical protein [Candidatus Thiodiazotropha endolucinida]